MGLSNIFRNIVVRLLKKNTRKVVNKMFAYINNLGNEKYNLE